MHKVAKYLNALPKSVQPAARRMLAEIHEAEDRAHALTVIDAFADEFGAKWPKAVAKIEDDAEPLLAFFNFPAEHWIHLKTTNPPIESTSPQCVCGPRSPRARDRGRPAWPWTFKLIESVQYRWRASTHPSSSPSSELAPPSISG